jgi:hypothetical protein
MTDLEINKALALVIGWQPIKVTDAVFVWRGYWCIFDYRDWNVIGPIAARYDCFPMNDDAGWFSSNLQNPVACADTPQKAIALAVIEGEKK